MFSKLSNIISSKLKVHFLIWECKLWIPVCYQLYLKMRNFNVLTGSRSLSICITDTWLWVFSNVVHDSSIISYKALWLFSTDAVFPNGMQNCEEEADISGLNDKLTDGYSQSKWVAEQIITSARKRGIPAAIYRLGIKACHSWVWVAFDRENHILNRTLITLI